ncbi:MAG: hypothetical protein LBE71_02635 [Dysgonamonadaceae bacterium]|jgi:hypothetical protein|nr:hypothetical protein [Dysgonamonadaceae bacterium]
MELYFKEERDRDFFNVCETIRKESDTYISVSEIAKKAVRCEAQSFYLSEQQYRKIFNRARIYPRIKNCKSEIRNEMYREIRSRFLEAKHENSKLKYSQIAKLLSEQKAPRFYIAEDRAVMLYYDLLKTLR